jgi:hypothetical protein
VGLPPPFSGESGGTQPPLMHTQPSAGGWPMQPPDVGSEPGIMVEISSDGALFAPAVLYAKTRK